MWPIIPRGDALVVIAVMFVLLLVSSCVFQPAWWRSRIFRAGVALTFGAMMAGLALWTAGHYGANFDRVLLGTRITYTGILVLGPAILVLPFTALMDRLLSRVLSPSLVPSLVPEPDSPSPALSRRAFITAGTATLPAMAAITGARGLLDASDTPRIAVIPLRFTDLHPDLEGLRILQLSDLHLGACAGLSDLSRALDVVMAAQKPDLIVLTGDVADDPELIPGALDLVARAGARYGVLASLGNHEYLHDIAITRPKFEASVVPLLVSSGQTLTIGRARLFVGGSDDPVHMHGDIAEMVRPSIEAAALHAKAGADFRLLLCHRPEGFGPAAKAGFDLTLSGHTHGGQIGVFGRSLLEKLRPGTGWWGTYARGRSRLYTTSGFGHWFPFRVGCPTEMPVIVLEGAPSGADRARSRV